MIRPKRNDDVAGSRTSRRGFLGKLGAGGLAVAAAQFARSTPALAANYGCCNLANNPPNTTYTYCHAHQYYTWTCYYAPCNECQCCETSGYKLSAGYCHRQGSVANAVRPDC